MERESVRRHHGQGGGRAGRRQKRGATAQEGGRGGEEKIQAGSNPLPRFLLQKGGSAVFYGRSAFSRHGTSLPPAFMDSVARYQRSSFFLRKAKKPAAPTMAIIATEEPIAIEDPHPPELPPAVVVAAVVPPGWVAFPPPAPVVVP